MNEKERFREGILNLNTRQFGTAMEIVVVLLRHYCFSQKSEYDLIDKDGKKIEVKSSRVLKSKRLDLNAQNFYDIVISEGKRGRLIHQEDVQKHSFDCNIQQIKTEEFDRLIYLLCFQNIIEIFEISKEAILKDKNIGYSDKQHRGNKGEGQFHVTNKNYLYHKNEYFAESISYEDLMSRAMAAKKERD